MKTLLELLVLFFILFILIMANQNSFPSEYSHIFIKFSIFFTILITQFIFNVIYDFKKNKKINPSKYLMDGIITGFAGIVGYSLYNDILLINVRLHYQFYSYMTSPAKYSLIQTLITILFIAFVKSIKNTYYGIQLITFKDSLKCNKKIEEN
jgi:hypothetical protein